MCCFAQNVLFFLALETGKGFLCMKVWWKIPWRCEMILASSTAGHFCRSGRTVFRWNNYIQSKPLKYDATGRWWNFPFRGFRYDFCWTVSAMFFFPGHSSKILSLFGPPPILQSRKLPCQNPGTWIGWLWGLETPIDFIAHRIHGAGIFTYISHKNQPNAGEYTTHGSLG